MARFVETRFIGALFGLAAGLVLALGAIPAKAQPLIPGDSGIVGFNAPLGLSGEVPPADLAPDGSFMQMFTFTVDLAGLPSGEAFVTVTPNVLPPDGLPGGGFLAGFATFMGQVTKESPVPPPGGPFDLVRDGPPETPRSNTIATQFAVMDGDVYKLTITGTLLDGVLLGDYSGNIGVTPLPGAALLFLSALGGLVVVRRYRNPGAAAA